MINYTYIWLYHAYLLVIPVNLCFDYSMGCISSITTMWDLRALSPVLIFTIVIIGVKFQNECRYICINYMQIMKTYFVFQGFYSQLFDGDHLVSPGFQHIFHSWLFHCGKGFISSIRWILFVMCNNL